MTVPATDDAAAPLSDHWLDDVTEPAQPVFDRATHRAITWFSGPARLARRGLSFAGTTPGKLTAMMVLLTVAIAAAGASLANFSSVRHDRLSILLSSTEPMNNAAHNLYTSLSLADTVATTGFVQSGIEPNASRTTYNDAIDRAAVAATQSVLGTDVNDEKIRELVVLVQLQLPVYTGMVEQARANHRADNAVAVTYMTNASTLMREEILPAAAQLFQLTSAKVATQQRELTAPQLIPVSGFLAAVLFLLGAQWWLWRLTRRRFNRGFLAATALMVVALTWVVTANALTWAAGAQRFEAAASPWEQLTNSQIAAQKARTSETLVLVTRQATAATADASGGQTRTSDFDAMVSSVTAALDAYDSAEHLTKDQGQALTNARTAINQWRTAHNFVMDDMANGRYDEAISRATALQPWAGQPTAAMAFNDLNDALSALIGSTRDAMRSYIDDSLDATRALGGAVGLITLGAILAIWIGIRPRLQEYL